ncbi:MAG TPA: L-arabinose isomerase, partial [Ilumatobacteraceae bacterium]|nr:L-arabinose isomerase [Ilumatobacteraceae bacterium]
MGRCIVPEMADYEVWFLTGSQSLYGDEVLAQVATQSQCVADMLDKSADVPCRVVWKPVLTSREAISQAIREANASSRTVGIITWMHTFSPAKMWIAGLRALDKPMLHLHTQANLELPWARIDFNFMNLNQAAHGDREFGYIETRLGVARTTVVGHASDPTVTSRIGDWCRAA